MNLCKADQCVNKVKPNRVYCSPSCRTKTTNKLYKDYKKTAESLSVSTRKEYELSPKYCKKCHKMLAYKKRNNTFCNRACSASYNTIGRIHSEETKRKIQATVVRNTEGASIRLTRSCEFCFKPTKLKRFCSKECYDSSGYRNIRHKKDLNNCSLKEYRNACSFSFGLRDYPDKFDFSLIEKHGWYKPKNRGNNLYGVSRDHMFSVKDGFGNKVDPAIISHPANCRLILHSDNVRKGSRSIITLQELLDRIEQWDLTK